MVGLKVFVYHTLRSHLNENGMHYTLDEWQTYGAAVTALLVES